MDTTFGHIEGTDPTMATTGGIESYPTEGGITHDGWDGITSEGWDD